MIHEGLSPETFLTYYTLILGIMVIAPSYYQTEKLVGVRNFTIINMLWVILIILGLIGGFKSAMQKSYDTSTILLIVAPPLGLLFELFLLMGSYNTDKAILKARKKLKH